MIIERPHEAERINRARKWVLVYGRRKTGKTFLIKNFVKYDEYFFVKRDRTIISEKNEKAIVYETFTEILKRTLGENKVVVVDEFHRLGDDFLDFLHYTKKAGKLILISSTLFLSKKLFSTKSALLGFFVEVPVTLISLGDCVKALKKFKLDKKRFVEFAVLLREPVAVEYFRERAGAAKIFAEILVGSIKAIPALIGEIFVEEERSISAVYEGVLRAIAAGKVVSTEISSALFARKLIKKDDPSLIQQYLSNLADFGVIKKVEVYGKKKFIYQHASPLAKLFYYADEKYNILERRPDEKEVERIAREILPKVVEGSVREHFAEKLGLKEAVVEAKDYDVDACLLKFKKPAVVIEVKWKEKIDREDVGRAEESLSKIRADERLFFVPDKNLVRSKVLKVLDVSDV